MHATTKQAGIIDIVFTQCYCSATWFSQAFSCLSKNTFVFTTSLILLCGLHTPLFS
ncbi:hypothetical protein SERLADRAFT_477073 [Serpula lacrymans var. lacrymans S7.9]|uniref:Uncharacterized protein n=1 Tax=Serpula lacrymans var. lacrymans (strain S7.9) TaxID=578457 RepID=F8P8A2_SERL9|nr:uncharacterized protein SERLADRAFT_477073 [Serpula lacrymans var. lacrymans S7.9]EGO20658.1 hypothetical protein SERLADRAFT_477073 [Serpula lacrymans var. lacrymans S7.9]